ncbi:unnamed protein product [Cyprideis torosa]|uniref:Uncharacterized protein n=1 Tax=Cyprideis torosa TaxID=163714 RepID=A0A7R8ZQ28_9CRUS|nr:unnamed protein product [Cyprideis torosa]CAG0895334.1 unnamed protein product [Cyprideis torosa]
MSSPDNSDDEKSRKRTRKSDEDEDWSPSKPKAKTPTKTKKPKIESVASAATEERSTRRRTSVPTYDVEKIQNQTFGNLGKQSSSASMMQRNAGRQDGSTPSFGPSITVSSYKKVDDDIEILSSNTTQRRGSQPVPPASAIASRPYTVQQRGGMAFYPARGGRGRSAARAATRGSRGALMMSSRGGRGGHYPRAPTPVVSLPSEVTVTPVRNGLPSATTISSRGGRNMSPAALAKLPPTVSVRGKGAPISAALGSLSSAVQVIPPVQRSPSGLYPDPTFAQGAAGIPQTWESMSSRCKKPPYQLQIRNRLYNVMPRVVYELVPLEPLPGLRGRGSAKKFHPAPHLMPTLMISRASLTKPLEDTSIFQYDPGSSANHTVQPFLAANRLPPQQAGRMMKGRGASTASVVMLPRCKVPRISDARSLATEEGGTTTKSPHSSTSSSPWHSQGEEQTSPHDAEITLDDDIQRILIPEVTVEEGEESPAAPEADDGEMITGELPEGEPAAILGIGGEEGEEILGIGEEDKGAKEKGEGKEDKKDKEGEKEGEKEKEKDGEKEKDSEGAKDADKNGDTEFDMASLLEPQVSVHEGDSEMAEPSTEAAMLNPQEEAQKEGESENGTAVLEPEIGIEESHPEGGAPDMYQEQEDGGGTVESIGIDEDPGPVESIGIDLEESHGAVVANGESMANQGHEEPAVNKGHEEPMVSEGHEEPMVSEGHEEPMVSEGHEEPMVSERHEEPMGNQGHEESMDNQGHEEPMDNQEHEEPVANQEHTEPMVIEGHVEPMANQGHEEPMVSKRHEDSMVSHRHDEPMVSQGHEEPMVNPETTLDIPNYICGGLGVVSGILGIAWGIVIIIDYTDNEGGTFCTGECNTWFIMCVIAFVFWILHLIASILMIVAVATNDRLWVTPFPFTAILAASFSFCVFIGDGYYAHSVKFDGTEVEYRWVLAPAILSILCFIYVIVAWCLGWLPRGWSPLDPLCHCGLGGP